MRKNSLEGWVECCVFFYWEGVCLGVGALESHCLASNVSFLVNQSLISLSLAQCLLFKVWEIAFGKVTRHVELWQKGVVRAAES